jgi:glycosyltransferase involved in cell wall biosynthesis
MRTIVTPDVPMRLMPWSPLHPSVGKMPSVAVMSTYPPTHCGLATFAAALSKGMGDVGARSVGIIDVNDEPLDSEIPQVVARLKSRSPRSRIEVARVINGYDFLLLQHEFGIFGGNDGCEILELLDDVIVPVVVTLHTVPLRPTPGQRQVLEDLAERADVLVAMTNVARQRFIDLYDVDSSKVVVIPHGATLPASSGTPKDEPFTFLTWGLLGPGKGIEWMIDAMAMVPELRNRIRYVVAGQTHPKILANDGDSYRDMLKRRSRLLGVDGLIEFDDSYRSLDSLLQLIGTASCVVLPYDSVDQITSGVLVDALAARRPVIATAFPHAVELLEDKAGLVVPHHDPVSLASAIRTLVTDKTKLSEMYEATADIARKHRWPAVAARYLEFGSQLVNTGSVVAS